MLRLSIWLRHCLPATLAGCVFSASVLSAFAIVAADATERRIVAKVNDDPVFADEVDRELKAAYGRDAQLDKVPEEAWRRAAEQVVRRRLVLEYLTQSKQAASPQDVDFALEQLKKELTAQKLTLDEYLRRGGWHENDFRRHLSWTLSWQRFLERTLTDANLQKYFQSHLPDFDGREVHVAHLLLKVDPADAKRRSERVAEAKQIRGQLAAGELTFAEAVKRHSEAPTAASSGGDLGFIRRHEPMPESFAKVALWLDEGEISQPVVTSFGVHLIQCLEVRPGKLNWQDAEGELRRSVAIYLFDWAADKQKTKTAIEWLPPQEPGIVRGER